MEQFFQKLSLDEVFVNKRGGKTASVLKDGKANATVLFPHELVRAPFGPNTFDRNPEATRQNLEIRCSPSLENTFREIDLWAKKYLAENSERLFKKKLHESELGYVSCVRKRSDYPALLKTKIYTAGKGAIKYWTPNGKPTEPPAFETSSSRSGFKLATFG
jgi:hypothetical protein